MNRLIYFIIFFSFSLLRCKSTNDVFPKRNECVEKWVYRDLTEPLMVKKIYYKRGQKYDLPFDWPNDFIRYSRPDIDYLIETDTLLARLVCQVDTVIRCMW